MKLEQMVEAIAIGFAEEMAEGDYSTFSEMKQSYWWDNDDIAGEIASFIEEDEDMSLANFIDEDDKTVWADDTDGMSLKDFMKLVTKEIKRITK